MIGGPGNAPSAELTTVIYYNLHLSSYYNIIIQLACAYSQYRRYLPYRADRSARYGKGRLYCMRALYLHRI